MTYSIPRFCLAILFGTCALYGFQEPVVDAGSGVAGPAQNVAQPYVPMTAGQNYLWSLHEIFNPAPLFFIAARAAIDHSENSPERWGQGVGGYASRAASHLARAAVRQNLAFGIRALDHEDPRYFRSPYKGLRKRTGYALGRTFVARSQRGGNMPAYSSLVADFATPFIAQAWRPEPISAGRELRTGAFALGVSATGNLCQEFWPDVRKRLRRN